MVFKAYVDDTLEHESPFYRPGAPVLPVVVNVEGGKQLQLIVTEAYWSSISFLASVSMRIRLPMVTSFIAPGVLHAGYSPPNVTTSGSSPKSR